MEAFEYARPRTKEEAVELLAAAAGRSAALAGGTDLLALMKDYVEKPKRLVSLGGVGELRGIAYDREGGLRIGALTTLEELWGYEVIRRHYPALGEAARRVGGPQIRNQGTVGGNLCQRPRCWYYRSGFGLLAQRGGRSMVVEGDNRYHAILGNDGPAYFVSPSTLVPVLMVLGARVALFGPDGPREIPLESFYRIPRKEGEGEHDLRPGEIVTEVLVPPPGGKGVASYEIRQRETLDWSLATAAVALAMDGGRVRSARVVLGQVAPIPWDSRAAADSLAGKAVTPETARKAGEAAVSGAKALRKNRYKIQLARVAVQRAVLRAAGQEV